MATESHIGAIQSRQARAREALAAKHEKEHTGLRAEHDRQRKRAQQGVDSRHTEKPRSGVARDHVELRSDEDEAKFRAGKHADLNAAQHHERQVLRDGHIKELEEARARPDGSLPKNSMAGHASAPSGLSPRQQAEHAALRKKHETQRKDLETRQADSKKSAGRYDHTRSKASHSDHDTGEHRRLLDQQRQEVEALHGKHAHENDVTQRRQQQQAAERNEFEARQRRGARAS
jgi:hypothetical protein